MTNKRLDHQEVPAFLDKEVSAEGQDKFGHTHLAMALKDLIEDVKHPAPYSIGLLGKWGTGKSTVKGLYLDRLRNDENKNGEGVKRRELIYPITFNAWKYAGEPEIRKSLFRHIFLQIDGSSKEVDQNLHKTVESTEYHRKSFREVISEFGDQYASGLLTVAFFVIVFVALLIFMAWGLGFKKPITISAGIVSSATFVGFLAQKLFSNLRISSLRKPIQIISPPSQTIDEFEDLFLNQLSRFKNTKKGKRVRRIVVFIDDLDRLTTDEMVSGLDGIRSLSDMASHKMPDDIGIVFVISCDEERIADALSKRRATPEIPAAVSNIQDARRYLDRIFQFRLEIPPFPKRDMRNFVLTLLETEYSALKTDLEYRKINLQDMVDRMIHPGVQTPRNAIQIMNMFAQSWWLGVLREKSAVGTDAPGGLGEGVVTQNPLTLAIICVIRTDFPDFYQALQKNPRIFEYFIDRFVHLSPLETMPTAVHEQLAPFATDESNGDQERWDVKPQHRGLRQFMSHVQDIRRPYSLQPLLALSQDPVSRRHGDKAVPIEEALRTSDVVELLDAVGFTGSSGTFPPDFSAILADIIDELRTETSSIQDNIAFTVARIDQRIPEKDKPRVLGFAIRRAGDSAALRWRLGPTKLHDLVPHADSEDLRALGRSLIEDITSDPANIRLPSREQPSLREGVEIAQTSAELVVNLIEKVGVPPRLQTIFGEWLLTRTVKIDTQSEQLPMAWLEKQLADHEEILLPLVRDEYPRIIAEEFSREEPEDLDLSAIKNRLDQVFNYFFKQGTETRVHLWNHIENFAKLRQPPFVSIAFTKFSACHTYADIDAAHSIFAAMASRFINYEKDSLTWPLDEEPSLRNIFTDIAEKYTKYDAENISHIVTLADTWSKFPERAHSAAKLYTVLEKDAPEEQTTLGQEWAKRLFKDLPNVCQKAIFMTVNSKDSPRELDTAIAGALADLQGPKPLSDHQISAFSRFCTMLDKSVRLNSPFSEQLEQLIGDTVRLVTQNPGDHVVSKARLFGKNLGYIPPANAQQLLNSFTQLRSHPKILAGVYNEMNGSWPVTTTEAGLDYRAQDLFNIGIATCSELGESNDAIQLLKSLDSLHNRAHLEQADNSDRLVKCAYGLWLHAPQDTEMLFRSHHEAKRSADQLVHLVQAAAKIEQSGGADTDQTLGTLVHEITCAGVETVESATASLIAEPAMEADVSPDPILGLWVRAVARHDSKPLIDILIDDDSTNDEQAVRLYNHVFDNLQQVSKAQFITLLKQVLSVQEGRDKTADALVRSLPEIAEQKFATDEEKRGLCEAVLSVLAEVPKYNRKAEIAKRCAPFGLKSVMRDGDYKNTMSEDDIDLLEQQLGKIRPAGFKDG